MKKIFIFLSLSVVVVFMMDSCKKGSFLDKQTETLTEDKVFADSALTVSFLTDVYAYTGQDIIPLRYNGTSYINSGNGNDYADLETLTTHSTSYYSAPQTNWIQGSYTPTNSPFISYWSTYYKRIRACNVLLQKLPSSPLSTAKKIRMAAEARFLRAFYYAALIRYFGSVQLMGDEVLDITDILVSKRNTYKECVDYISNELDMAAKDLPTAQTQQAIDYGRATQGACLALKARVLLTAASPLFNGSPIANNSNIAYSVSYDASLWQKASDACKAVMDLGQYSLVVDNTTRAGHGFWKMFVKGRMNSEYIFAYQIALGHNLENYEFPISRGGTGAYNNPTENVVQCFGMKSGALITDANSGYDAANPYLNRDPRFYYSIIYNQAPIWKSGSGTTLVPVAIYYDAATSALATDMIQGYNNKTGYYSRKMCNDSLGNSTNIDRAYPVIRYAEMILGYAEAQNELGNTETAVTYLNMIRSRAGITAGTNGRYGVPAGVSQASLRSLIQNEYIVELFQEGHYYYDCRRWKTAMAAENLPVQGMYITKQINGTFTYATIKVLTTSFTNRAYFAPIPQTEINKSATLEQNPGW